MKYIGFKVPKEVKELAINRAGHQQLSIVMQNLLVGWLETSKENDEQLKDKPDYEKVLR